MRLQDAATRIGVPPAGRAREAAAKLSRITLTIARFRMEGFGLPSHDASVGRNIAAAGRTAGSSVIASGCRDGDGLLRPAALRLRPAQGRVAGDPVVIATTAQRWSQ
ncbi:MAG: hypothetical protein ACREF3_12055 [Acetobacteraceae bacterium]